MNCVPSTPLAGRSLPPGRYPRLSELRERASGLLLGRFPQNSSDGAGSATFTRRRSFLVSVVIFKPSPRSVRIL